jgi:hypothetical protein
LFLDVIFEWGRKGPVTFVGKKLQWPLLYIPFREDIWRMFISSLSGCWAHYEKVNHKISFLKNQCSFTGGYQAYLGQSSLSREWYLSGQIAYESYGGSLERCIYYLLGYRAHYEQWKHEILVQKTDIANFFLLWAIWIIWHHLLCQEIGV